jgi:hypothetical protein
MISPAKLAANRANAKKSTGPRTTAGKVRSAQNARRHGLRAAILPDAGFSEKAKNLARRIAGEGANEQVFEAACRIAEAQMDYVLARHARMAVRNQDPYFTKNAMVTLRRLLAIERHERRAASRRKFALRDFDAACAAAGWFPPRDGEWPQTAAFVAPAGEAVRNSARTNPPGGAGLDSARTNPPSGSAQEMARTKPTGP